MRMSLRVLVAVLLTGLSLSVAHASWFEDTADKAANSIKGIFSPTKNEIPYCKEGQNCSLKIGVDGAVDGVSDLIKNETASQYAQRVAGNVVAVLSIVGVLFIVYAGFLYLTAGGDDDKTKSAKSIIVSVVIGFAIVFFAWAIVSFVTGKLLATPADQAVPPAGTQVSPFGN